jgi:hypothetical protein
MSDSQPANFRQLVKLMRDAQKAYWRDRSQSKMRACLRLELRVDNWLLRHQDELGEQLALEKGEDDAPDHGSEAAAE